MGGAGGGVVASTALLLMYKERKLAEEEPQYWALFPGHGVLQLERSATLEVPASSVSAQ